MEEKILKEIKSKAWDYADSQYDDPTSEEWQEAYDKKFDELAMEYCDEYNMHRR